MTNDKICILGGTGFVGRSLAARLAGTNTRIRILTRHPQRHRRLKVLPNVELVRADIHDSTQLEARLADCDVAINLVGILNEAGRDGQGFHKVHVELPRKLINACQTRGIQRLLHMSALNAGRGSSHYLQTKGKGWDLVRSAKNIQATAFEPSVIFGTDDAFINRFVQLLRLIPCCFPLACPEAKLAPVWVGDVVEVMARTLDDPKSVGHSYRLCGPNVYTLRQLVEYSARTAGLKRRIIPLNDSLSRLQAKIMEFAPGKPFSMDNYLSLQTDSICTENSFYAGITPKSIIAIVNG
ncbi:MAG: complex I NDUFA9 subunit family protein [Gammaproteobacteria bacterium]|nr:complex I NDUFA9 subunit family protein [Gammaproteobacteria bacterium]